MFNPQTMPGALTLEQEFKLKILKDQVGQLTLEQAQEYLIEVMRQMMVKDNLAKHLLKTPVGGAQSEGMIDAMLSGGDVAS